MLKKIIFNNTIDNDAIITDVIMSYNIDYSKPFGPDSINGMEVLVNHIMTNGQIFGKLKYTVGNENYEKEFIIPVEKDVSVIRSKPAPKYKPFTYMTSGKEPGIRIEDVYDRETGEPFDVIYYYLIDTGLVIAKGVINNSSVFSIVLKTKPTSGKLFLYGEKNGELSSVSERHIELAPELNGICLSTSRGATLNDDRADIIDVISTTGDIVSNTAVFVGSSSSIAIEGRSRPGRITIPSAILRNEKEFDVTIFLKKPSEITRRYNKKISVYNTYVKYTFDNPIVEELSSPLPKTLLGKVAVTKEGYFTISKNKILSVYKLENNVITAVKENVMILDSDDDMDSVSVGINEVVAYPYKDKTGLYYLEIDSKGAKPLLYNSERKINDGFVSGTKLVSVTNNNKVDMLLSTKYLNPYIYPEEILEDGSYMVRYTINNHLIFKNNGTFLLNDAEYSHPFSGDVLEIKTFPIKTGVNIAIRAKNSKLHIIRINVNSKIASSVYTSDVTGNAFIISDIYNNKLTVVKD